jgi:N-acetylneuraminate synthase
MRTTRRFPLQNGNDVFIIAEGGVNHNGNVDLAIRLIDAAKNAGADAIKFQTFKASRLVSRAAPKADYQRRTTPASQSQLDMISRLELTEGAHLKLARYCRAKKILFLSSPFDEGSADLLDRLGIKIFKIPSGEITHRQLLEHIARKNKAIVLSTGMSTLAEVKEAVSWIRATTKAPLALLHCVSDYPAPADQANLRAMETLRKSFKLPVGYSDHTPGIDIAIAAAALGAVIVEKHLTLDRRLPGPDQSASLEPSDFKEMVSAIRRVTSALGDGVKKVAPCEERNRIIARRSLVAAHDLLPGRVIRKNDLQIKRPGNGIPPAQLEKVLGRKVVKRIGTDEVLKWDMFEGMRV